MLVLGPTLMFDVPGFLEVSLLALRESNAPYSGFARTSTACYTYKTHAMLTAVPSRSKEDRNRATRQFARAGPRYRPIPPRAGYTVPALPSPNNGMFT